MKTIVEYINNVLNESVLNEGSHDAECSVKEVMKGIVNKKMSLDELSDLLADDGWEFCEEVPGENGDNDMLVFIGNFSNNAEGDDDYLDIDVEKHGNMYKILSYTLE
jgi:hypothetical protein